MYVGLDTATTMGIALWYPRTKQAVVYESKGTPVDQLYSLTKLNLLDEAVFVLEKQHVFINAVTTRSLLERYGYIKNTLASMGFVVKEVSPKVARHALGVVTKQEVHLLFQGMFPQYKLTDNHTDALAVALYQSTQDGWGVASDFKLEVVR